MYAARCLLKPFVVRRRTSLPVMYINNLWTFIFSVLLVFVCFFRANFSGVSLAPFRSTVLKPNLDLTFCHSKGIRQPRPLRPGQVFRLFEGFFEREYLMPAERWSSMFPFAVCLSFAADRVTLSRCGKHAEIERRNGYSFVNSRLVVLTMVI